jgi:hypothetical protein
MNHCGILALVYLSIVTIITIGVTLVPILFRILVREMNEAAKNTAYRQITT